MFIAGLILALGSMFYLKLIWFLPLIWISLWTPATCYLERIIYPVVAYLLLALFLFTWYWGVMDMVADSLNFLAGIWLLKKLRITCSNPIISVLYIYYGYFLLLVMRQYLYDQSFSIQENSGSEYLPGAVLYVSGRSSVFHLHCPFRAHQPGLYRHSRFHISSPTTSTGKRIHGSMN